MRLFCGKNDKNLENCSVRHILTSRKIESGYQRRNLITLRVIGTYMAEDKYLPQGDMGSEIEKAIQWNA